MKKIDQSIWVFQLPSGLEIRLVNVPQEDLDFLDGIEQLREQVAAQAAVIEMLKRAIGDWDRAETPSELQSAEAGLLKALSIPTNGTQILDEVRRAEREKCAVVAGWQADGESAAREIRAME